MLLSNVAVRYFRSREMVGPGTCTPGLVVDAYHVMLLLSAATFHSYQVGGTPGIAGSVHISSLPMRGIFQSRLVNIAHIALRGSGTLWSFIAVTILAIQLFIVAIVPTTVPRKDSDPIQQARSNVTSPALPSGPYHDTVTASIRYPLLDDVYSQIPQPGFMRRMSSCSREIGPLSMPSAILNPRERITKFTNCRLVRGNELVEQDLWVSSGSGKVVRSQEVFYSENIVPDVTVNLGGRIISPGMIDVQLNGAFGFNFSQIPEPGVSYEKSLRQVNKSLVHSGVTSYLPTVTSEQKEVYHHVSCLANRHSKMLKLLSGPPLPRPIKRSTTCRGWRRIPRSARRGTVS
jgi:hypothetical protein